MGRRGGRPLTTADVGPDDAIRWPERFRPGRAPVHVRNDLDIDGPGDRVWSWLCRAALWPSWYPNSSEVYIEGGGEDLGLAARFRWRTFGVSLASVVEEFEPATRLSWSARGLGVEVYHGWRIVPTGSGCHVRTEESQYGALTRLDHRLRPGRMHAGHQLWLERLQERARSGPPPP